MPRLIFKKHMEYDTKTFIPDDSGLGNFLPVVSPGMVCTLNIHGLSVTRDVMCITYV